MERASCPSCAASRSNTLRPGSRTAFPVPIDGANHFTILEALAQVDGTLTCALLDMIDGY
jgi:hypothetical protein